MLLAPTEVVVLNIDGTTIHASLGVNSNWNKYAMGKLSEASKTKIKYEIEVALIDEVSMIFTIRLLQIHKRICEIFVF